MREYEEDVQIKISDLQNKKSKMVMAFLKYLL
jgi:hypothetical protein